jgi:hypothetical protein
MRLSSSRRILALCLAVAAVAPIPAGAGPLAGTVGPGWFGTSNTDLVANLPVNSGTAGARVVGDRMVVTDQNGLTVYDISDPTLPRPLGFTPIPQQYYFTEEDVPTNGEIALVGQFGDLTPKIRLNVVDISLEDNAGGQPAVVGRLERVDEHTFECALDCTWAYGSAGLIVDLRNPTAPRDAGQWDDAVRAQRDPATGEAYTFRAGTHDVTEVAPGILLTSSNPMFLLDVRTTPATPEVIGVGTFADSRFIHANLWPYHGDLPADPSAPAAEGWSPDWSAFDRHVLVGGETSPLPSACAEDDGAFMTVPWQLEVQPDGSPFVRMSFDPAAGQGHEYRPEPGTFVDGGSPYSQYCTHWFTTRPGFHDGGLLAMGWYEFGTRFLEVAADGSIAERGWLIPAGGSTSAAYWLDGDGGSDAEGPEVVLTADYQRGVDVLTFDPRVEPEDVEEVAVPGLVFERAVLPRPQVLEDWYTGFGCPLPG